MSRSWIVAATLAVLTVGHHTSPVAAKCARVMLVPQVLTHAGDTVPATGGVLVGYGETTDDLGDQYEGHDPARNDDWVLAVGKRKLRPRIEQLAPGLAVYRPGAVRGARLATLTLRDRKGKALASLSLAPRGASAPLPAPAVTAVTSTSSKGFRGRLEQTVTAQLGGAIPAGAAALIAYEVDGATVTPLSWGRVAVGSTGAVVVYDTPGRCSGLPDGMTAPAPGDTVVFAWVDQFGGLSPRSASIKVK